MPLAVQLQVSLTSHYIAESQCSTFIQSLSAAHFCNFHMDGTTDDGNAEDELIVVMSFPKDDEAGKVKSFARFFSIEVPTL